MSAAAEPTDDQLGPADVAKALVFGVVGAGASIVTAAPKAVKQARSDLTAARFIGEMAVTQGAAQLRERLGGSDDEPVPTKPSPGSPGGSSTTAAADDEVPIDEATDDVATDDGAVADTAAASPSAEELAIPDYDTVPAIDVVMQLADLDPGERASIEAYELANRRRRTILGKVEQLRGNQ